jgi:hypothetical protein
MDGRTRVNLKWGHKNNICSSSRGNNSGNSHARVMNLVTQHVCNFKNILYLKFEVDTLKSKKVKIFLEEL